MKTEGFRNPVAPHAFETRELEYQYDERQRLEGVIVDGGTGNNETFGYDSNGNRTSYTGPAGIISTADTLYDSQDRLKNYGAATFTYGESGELRTKTVGAITTTYTYDALANLTKVQRNARTISQFRPVRRVRIAGGSWVQCASRTAPGPTVVLTLVKVLSPGGRASRRVRTSPLIRIVLLNRHGHIEGCNGSAP